MTRSVKMLSNTPQFLSWGVCERSKPKPKARIHISLHRFFIEVHRPITDHAENQAAPCGAEGPTPGRGPQH